MWLRVPVDGEYWTDVFPNLIVLAIGIGSSFPALMTLAMSGATQEDAGLASGLVNTSAQVGGALGLAVLATLSATRTDDLLAAGESQAEALVGGYHLAFGIGAALVVVALLIGIVVLEKEADAQAHAVEVLEGDGAAAPGEREPAYSEG